MMYVDVNVFFYWLTDHKEFGNVATRIIRRIETGEKAVTSTLTMWLLHILLKETTENYDPRLLVEKIRRIPFLKIVPLSWYTSKRLLTYLKNMELILRMLYT